jgi:hypothetical protein
MDRRAVAPVIHNGNELQPGRKPPVLMAAQLKIFAVEESICSYPFYSVINLLPHEPGVEVGDDKAVGAYFIGHLRPQVVCILAVEGFTGSRTGYLSSVVIASGLAGIREKTDGQRWFTKNCKGEKEQK